MRLLQNCGLSADERRAMNAMMPCIEIIMAHPLFGVGYGHFEKLFDPLHTPWDLGPGSYMLHSYFLNVAVATGLISTTLLILLFVWFARALWRATVERSQFRQAYLALGFLGALIGVMTELVFYPGGSGLKFLWAYLGFAFVSAASTKVVPKQ